MNKLLASVAVVVPFVGFVAALCAGASSTDVVMCVTLSLLTGLGITVGYHRFFTHSSFSAGPCVSLVLGILGSMAMQGPLFTWVGTHRRHHRYSDEGGDVHSPHAFTNIWRGFVHAHFCWMFSDWSATAVEYTKDIRRSKIARFIDRSFVVWVVLGLILPAAVGGWSGFLWGGFARIFLVLHTTWSINSVCHLWGRQPFDSRDESKNVAWLALPSLGESWHNNHHAFPSSARHGLKRWQIDVSYYVIYVLEFFGLAWNVKRAPAKLLAKWENQ